MVALQLIFAILFVTGNLVAQTDELKRDRTATGKSFKYDAAGNRIGRTVTSTERWLPDAKANGFAVSELGYDGRGRRIVKFMPRWNPILGLYSTECEYDGIRLRVTRIVHLSNEKTSAHGRPAPK